MQFISAFFGFGFLVSEIGLSRWRNSARTAGSRRMDASSLRLLWIVIVTAITAGTSLAMAGIGPRLPRAIPWDWLGGAIFVAGTVLRWWSILYLGRFFTVDVAVAADHRIVNTGPYRLVRHPSYSGLLLQFTGLSLALGNGLSVAIIILPILVALLHRIKVEEAALRDGLGEDYAVYMQKTTRLIPWVF